MPEAGSAPVWRFHHIGVIVTGTGEKGFLPQLFRSLTEAGHCTFEVIARIGQRTPFAPGSKRDLKMLGSNKLIPDRDATEIGVPARRHLAKRGEFALVLLIDDLEQARAERAQDVFQRYREALDRMLLSERSRASVHFLVNMLEAYYFADAAAINAVLGTTLADYAGDVEDIRHPKNELKKLESAFDEVVDGAKIVALLDVRHVLSNPASCASLRVLFAWCAKAIEAGLGDEYRLETGIYSVVTGPQLAMLAERG
jgi:hypothetical protein